MAGIPTADRAEESRRAYWKIFLRRAGHLLCKAQKFFIIHLGLTGPCIARIASEAGKDPKKFSNSFIDALRRKLFS